MSKIIKGFNEFSNNPEERTNEEFDLGNLFTGALNFVGSGLTKTIKEKIASALLEKLGIEEKSLLSGIVQEIVDAIPVSDYYDIVMGDKADLEYLAPKIASAIQELINKKGFDGIAKQLGISTDPPNNWIYNTIINGLQGNTGKENITRMLKSLFSSNEESTSVGKIAISGLSPEDKSKLTSAMVKRASDSSQGDQKETSTGFSDLVSSFLGGMTGNK